MFLFNFFIKFKSITELVDHSQKKNQEFFSDFFGLNNIIDDSLYINEYKNLVIFIFISLVVSFFLVFISYIGGTSLRLLDIYKISVYECGFDTIDESRQPQNVLFYIVGVVFIIFDIEIIFLFPWIVVVVEVSIFDLTCFVVGLLFLIFIIIGFIYEYKQNIFDLSDSKKNIPYIMYEQYKDLNSKYKKIIKK